MATRTPPPGQPPSRLAPPGPVMPAGSGGGPGGGEDDGGGSGRGGGGSQRWRIVTLVVLGLALVALVLALVFGLGAGGDETAAAFSVASLRQPAPPVRLSDYRGRPVVINFFASWCAPCRTELPMLEAAKRRAGPRVAFIGIDVSDTRGPALAMVNDAGVTYPLGVDPSYHVSADLYHLFGLPTTVFVAADGTVVETYRGQLTPGALRRWLAAIESRGGGS